MIIVGKKKFLKKDKSGYCYQANCLVEFSDNQKAGGCIGLEAKGVFISEKYYNKLTEEDFNRECEFTYGMSPFGTPEPVGHMFAKEK